MSLISDIKAIVSNLYPSSTFYLSSKFNANVQSFFANSPEYPLIILDNEFSKDSSIQKNNNILKDSKVLISILKPESIDNTDEESETIRQECEAIADRIAVNIYQLIPVRLTGNNQRYKITPMFHVYSQNLTGVALEMQVNYNEVVPFNSRLRWDDIYSSMDSEKITFDLN